MKIDSAEHVEAAHRADQLLRDGRPEIAFVGRSNVGKSSLMNRLLGRKGLARTSSTPGRTRAVHYFLINRRLYFVDLPGYGYAKAAKTDREVWARLVDRYFHHDRGPAGSPPLVIQLVDAKVGATALDHEAQDYLASFDLPQVIVATKADRLSRNRLGSSLAAIRRSLGLGEGEGPLAVSAQTGQGIPELWKHITSYIESGGGPSQRNQDG